MEYGIVYLKVKKVDCAKIEKVLHTAFAPQRINANREFFRIQVEQAKAILELFHHTDVTEEVSDEIESDLTDDDKAASAKAQIHRPCSSLPSISGALSPMFIYL